MYEIYCKLRDLKNRKDSDVAKATGITKSTFTDWKNGRSSPKQDKLQKIADYFGVTLEYLLGRDIAKTPESKKGIRINVYGSVPAGIPIEAIEDVIDWEEIPSDWTKDGQEYIALRVKGESMSPKYLDGDIVIIKLQPNCESGQDAVVYVNGYDATLKRVIKKENAIILQPLNPEFETKVYGPGDEEIKVLGIVIELRRKI